jgi:hypothetical protein
MDRRTNCRTRRRLGLMRSVPAYCYDIATDSQPVLNIGTVGSMLADIGSSLCTPSSEVYSYSFPLSNGASSSFASNVARCESDLGIATNALEKLLQRWIGENAVPGSKHKQNTERPPSLISSSKATVFLDAVVRVRSQIWPFIGAVLRIAVRL